MELDSSMNDGNHRQQTKVQILFIRLTQVKHHFLTLAITVLLALFILYKATQTEQHQEQSEHYITQPQINDIYFLDYRLMSDALRPQEKYRVAKIVDITGDVITLRYGNMLYFRQQAAIDGIRYGQLRYSDYFEPKRYDFVIPELEKMWQSGAIYMVRRPVNNELFGNYVSEDINEIESDGSSLYTPGKREYIAGNAMLKENYLESNIEQGIALLNQSADHGYAPGQVSLAEIYLAAKYMEKDLTKALFWLKQASLQSYKPAVLKYVIVCKQVASCNVMQFYDELLNAGVNIKVRNHDFTLSTLND